MNSCQQSDALGGLVERNRLRDSPDDIAKRLQLIDVIVHGLENGFHFGDCHGILRYFRLERYFIKAQIRPKAVLQSNYRRIKG